MNGRTAPAPVHVAVAEDVAVTHGYDQVIILSRLPSQPGFPDGAEWITTWGRYPEDKQAAAVIGKAIREGVVAPLEELRGLLREALPLLPGFGIGSRSAAKRQALVERIQAVLEPVKLETIPRDAHPDPDRS